MHIASVAFAHSFVWATIHFFVTQNLYPIYDTLNHKNSNVCANPDKSNYNDPFYLTSNFGGKKTQSWVVSGHGVHMNTIGDLKSPDGYT